MNERPMTMAIVVLALAWSQAVAAQEASIDDSHRQAAFELIEIMGIEEQMLAGAETMTEVMLQQTPQMAPYRDLLREWYESFMTFEVFGEQLADLYAGAYTEAELRDIIAFYESPTGQKSLRVMPELMAKSAEIGAREANERQAELAAMIRARQAEIEASEAPQDETP